jgi:MraZ protein
LELQAQDDRPPILTNLVDCPALGLFSHDHWLQIEDRLTSMSQHQPEIQSIQRMLVSGAVECPLDSQGRVLVPPHLREHASLGREVTIAGVGKRIELWDRARFEQELQGIRERGPEVSRIAAELGC